MEKRQKITTIIIGVIILFGAFGLYSVFSSTKNLPEANPDDIVGISQYFVQRDASNYNVRFSLIDKDDSLVTSDASIDFMVKTDNGAILYSKNFAIRSGDFKIFQLVLNGEPIIAYSWQINNDELKRGLLDFHTAYITVTLPNGKSFTSEAPVL